LPDINFLKLDTTSDLIDVGTDTITASVIIDSADFSGIEPDLGYDEYIQLEAPPAYTPQLSTNYPTKIHFDQCFTGGNIITDGGAEITAKGVCWSTQANPTTSDSTIVCGTGDADYTQTITGLDSGTEYHVRAYATNSEGTSYGADESFTTTAFSRARSPNGKKMRVNGKTLIFR